MLSACQTRSSLTDAEETIAIDLLGPTRLVDGLMHSYTVSLRQALRGRVEVIELAPSAVQTDLTPGQRTRNGYMPLDAFADEPFALFSRQPTPPEILVDRVRFLRFAEAENRFEETLAKVNEPIH